jgi:hypothetical protein
MQMSDSNNQQFLQYDNGQNAENRMLVFYSPDSLERLATLVSNCALGVFFTGQQGLDIVVTMGHNLGKDLDGFVSGDGCQVFHGISGF